VSTAPTARPRVVEIVEVVRAGALDLADARSSPWSTTTKRRRPRRSAA
jgi:hypothetical protein